MSNHVTEEEREKRINRVIELIKSGMSLRQCAIYLTENEFPISYVTVSDYVKRGLAMNKEGSQEAVSVIDKHKEPTIEDETVQKRVKQVYELLKEGFTFEEIANNLKESPYVIYRDFTNRIKKLTEQQMQDLNIDINQIKIIEKNLENNSFNNLKNQELRR